MTKLDFISVGIASILVICIYLTVMYILYFYKPSLEFKTLIIWYMFVTSLMFTGSIILKLVEWLLTKFF